MRRTSPDRSTQTTHRVRRSQRLTAGLLAVSGAAVIAMGGTSESHAVAIEKPGHSPAKSSESNDAVARWFQNVTFTNRTTTPLHFRASLSYGGYREFDVEVGQRTEVNYDGLIGLDIFAGSDANSPLWASYSDLAMYLDGSPAKTGYLWAKGMIRDADSGETQTFKVATGDSQTVNLERKTFTASFSQETSSHGWEPRAELTFGGTYEATFPSDSVVTVKNRTNLAYLVDGQRIERMQESSRTSLAPKALTNVAKIAPAESSKDSYPATDVALGVAETRSGPSQIVLSDSGTGQTYFASKHLWGTQGTALGRSEPRNGVTMTVWRATNVHGKAHFVITIYNV